MRRIGMTLAATAAVTALSATPALAHECFNASRSAQGNASATHSSRWVNVSVVGFANSPDFPPGVDPQCFIEHWLDGGGPESFTVRSDKTLGAGSSNPNLGNGRGIDHIEDAYGALFGSALGACAL